jgi:uncharacterized protein
MPMQIDVVWVGESGRVRRLALQLEGGASLRDALSLIEDADLLGALGRRELSAAVFGRPVEDSTLLQPGDRIELVAGLEVDPKVARRRRADRRRRAATQVAPAAQR